VKIQDNAVTLAKLATDLQAYLVPTGSITHYAGDTAPTGWLICDGGAVSRTTYSDLFAKVGIRFGQGDGTTTFNLPDGRGRVIRMVDGGASRDPDSAARTAMNTGGATGNNIGSVQLDEFKAHTHTVSPPAFVAAGTGVQSNTGLQINAGTLTTSSSGGNETRMKNWNANLIIKT
jgi:microcystin-dependent protein